MQIRCLSDLHLEFGLLQVPVIPNENEIICVLAGDIGIADYPSTYVDFVHQMAIRHKAVIYLAGNYEFYHSSFLRVHDKIKESIGSEFNNIHIGNNFTVNFTNEEENIFFICSTLWTDINKADPLSMWDVKSGLNDYNYIRTGTIDNPYKRPLDPVDTIKDHNISKVYIFEQIQTIKQNDPTAKIVVVTHMAPSYQSVIEKYKNSRLTPAFVSELSNEILDTSPMLWIHGHVHDSLDYMIGETRIVCNPRGYIGQEVNPAFNPNLIIEA
jgi:hypothetical protein